MVTAESQGSVADVNQVTLGGAPLAEIRQQTVGSSSSYNNIIWLGYLKDAQILSGTAVLVTWTVAPTSPFGEVKVQAATYENVNQTTPIAGTNQNSATSVSSIQAGSVSVGEGDRLVYATVCGGVENHTAPAGYSEQLEQDGTGNDHSNASAHRDSTGTSPTENPAASWSGSNRLAIISAVLNGSPASSGTIISPAIDYGSFLGATDWGQLLFTDSEPGASDIKYDVQYWNGASWKDTSIINQDSSPVDITSLNPTIHNPICLKATLTAGSTPSLCLLYTSPSPRD